MPPGNCIHALFRIKYGKIHSRVCSLGLSIGFITKLPPFTSYKTNFSANVTFNRLLQRFLFPLQTIVLSGISSSKPIMYILSLELVDWVERVSCYIFDRTKLALLELLTESKHTPYCPICFSTFQKITLNSIKL